MRAGLRFLTVMKPIVTIFEGDIWTANPRQPRAASIGIDSNGMIAAVESVPERLAAEFPNAKRTRLPSRALGIPAFHDAHNHWGFAAFDHAESLVGVSSIGDAYERLSLRAEKNPDGWVVGFGWNTHLLPLAQSDLDRVSTTRPVAVFDKSTHAVQLNGAGVKEVREAFDAAVRDGHPGTLVEGRLLESSNLVFGAMRLPSAALEKSLMDLQGRYLSVGIASLDDMDVLTPQILDSLQDLYTSRRLTIPCHGFIDFGRFSKSALPEPRSDGAFRLVGMKSYMDGALGARSALMDQPFIGEGGRGVRLLDRECFRRRFDLAVERGYRHVALHAIGDRAVADATSYLYSVAGNAVVDRLRIEHFQLADRVDRERCFEAGIAVCMQPNFTSDVADYADRLGERAWKLCEHRSVLDSGALLTFGSDGMPTGPIHGLRCAVEHPNPAQRLSVEESLRAYTIDACRGSCTDDRRGSLTVGNEANLAVLNRDIVKEGRIDADVVVMATIVNGEVRHLDPQWQSSFGTT